MTNFNKERQMIKINIINKKIISFSLVLSFLGSFLLSNFASAKNDYSSKDQFSAKNYSNSDFVIDSNGVLTSYKGTNPYVEIPSNVKEIGKNAFLDKRDIKMVTIPSNVKKINDSAFKDCKGLKQVNFSEGLQSIGDFAFESTAIDVIEVPKTVKSIGNKAFWNTKLEIIKLNEGLESLGSEVFTSCYKIYGISLPKTLKRIEGPLTTDMSSSFKWLCVKNKDLNFVDQSKLPTETWVSAVYFAKNNSTLKKLFDDKKTSSTKISFKDITELKLISTFEFEGGEISLKAGEQKNLSLKILPSDATDKRVKFVSTDPEIVSVTDAGLITANKSGEVEIKAISAFGDVATKKVKVKVSEDEIFKTDINGKLIGYYGDDVDIVIPDKVKEISKDVFKSNLKINSIKIGKNTKKIDDEAFSGCKNLKKVDFEGCTAIETIGDNAFKNDSSLENITIPKSVKKIGKGVFSSCTSLKKVQFEDISEITEIPEKAFSSCNNITSFSIPQKCQVIGKGALSNCGNLKQINFKGNNLLKIEDDAFRNNYSLIEVSIPEGVKTIGKGAFLNCKNMLKLNLPKSFEGTSSGDDIYGIFDISTAENEGKLREINIDNGNKNFYSYMGSVYKGSKLIYAPQGLKELIVKENTTEIGQEACNTHLNLEKLVVKKGLKKVGRAAFANCFGLSEVTLPDDVEVIENAAFLACEKLTKFRIPKNVKEISQIGLYELENVEELIVPDGVTVIKKHAVAGYDKIKHLTYSRNLKVVEDNGSQWAPLAEELYLPEGLERIGKQGFAVWSSITHLEIPKSVQKIESEAFLNPESLKSVYIPGETIVSPDILISKNRSRNPNNKIMVFTMNPNNSILALANNSNVEFVNLDYKKNISKNRKVEIQQLENLLTDENKINDFELSVDETKPDEECTFAFNVKISENNKPKTKLKKSLKAVIELLPEEEQKEYDVFLIKDGKRIKLKSNRLHRFIRAEINETGTIVLSERTKTKNIQSTKEIKQENLKRKNIPKTGVNEEFNYSIIAIFVGLSSMMFLSGYLDYKTKNHN